MRTSSMVGQCWWLRTRLRLTSVLTTSANYSASLTSKENSFFNLKYWASYFSSFPFKEDAFLVLLILFFVQVLTISSMEGQILQPAIDWLVTRLKFAPSVSFSSPIAPSLSNHGHSEYNNDPLLRPRSFQWKTATIFPLFHSFFSSFLSV